MNQQVQTQQAKPFMPLAPVRTGILQRKKCACGGEAGPSGECEACQKKRLGLQRKTANQNGAGSSQSSNMVMQRKLTIGSSNDPLEHEADRIANQVMATPSHSRVSGTPLKIQRFTGQASGQMDTAPASVDRVLAGAGKPLEPALQQDMEQRFGHDFSRVRVHSGGAAEQSAREVNAQAYTVGQNIVFGAGKFAPGTHEGRRLIAHELTHVVQQTGGIQAKKVSKQSNVMLKDASASFDIEESQIQRSLEFSSTSEMLQRREVCDEEGVCHTEDDENQIPADQDSEEENATDPGALPAGNNQLFFEYNSDVLSYSDEVEIAAYVQKWRNVPGPVTPQVQVDAYASEEGQEAYNSNLSAQRAQAVKDKLVSLGIPTDKITERLPLSLKMT
jgi:outer membrane protein OmpA-like peptidoglycan-associated protein